MNNLPPKFDGMIEQEERGPGFLFWLIFGAGYVVFFSVLSYLAPCGMWSNSVLGIPFWQESDPGMWYVVSAHQMFFDRRGVIYPGHPGLTLQLILFLVQKIYFVLAGAGNDFSHFTARHIAHVFIFSKIIVSLLHVVSFYLLYLFSMRLIKKPRAAVMSALAYATCFPVLYYASRISVEPLAVIFFLSSFLAAWKYSDCIRENKTGAAFIVAGVTAFLAVSGIMTKMHYLLPLPVFVFACMVFGARNNQKDARPTGAVRFASAAVYVVSAVVFIVLYSQLINWKDFISLWGNDYFGGELSPRVDGSALIIRSISYKLAAISHFPFKSYFPKPSMNWNGVFTICELPFAAFSIVGLAVYLIGNRRERRNTLWPAVTAAVVIPAWLYNGSFHYLFIPFAFISVFFGYYADVIFGTFGEKARGAKFYVRLAAVALIFHFFSSCLAVQSRFDDVKKYVHEMKPFHDAMSMLGPGERMGILVRGNDRFDLSGSNLGDYAFSMHGRKRVIQETMLEYMRFYDIGKLRAEEIASRMRNDHVALVINAEKLDSTVAPVPFSAWARRAKP